MGLTYYKFTILILVVFVLSADSHADNDDEHIIDITNSSAEHPSIHTFKEYKTVTFRCSWPGSAAGTLHYLVYINENIVLNSSLGVSLTHTIHTSCRHSGRYACGSGYRQGVMTSHDGEMDLLVSDCNPRMCADKDINRTISASPGSDIQFTFCVLTTLNSSNYPILKYSSRWITPSLLDEKLRFTFTPQSSMYHKMNMAPFTSMHHNSSATPFTSKPLMYHNMTITFLNVTLEDYGETVLILHTSTKKSMNIYFSINPKGPLPPFFNFNESNQILTCQSSWYPRTISISRRYIGYDGGRSGQTLNTVTNTFRNETVVNISPLPLGTCHDMGLYECRLTDFKNRSQALERFIQIPNCAPRLCDGHLETMVLTAKLGGPASLRVCIMGTTVDPPPKDMSVVLRRNGTEVNRLRYGTESVGSILHVNITLTDIRESDEGDYTAYVVAPTSKLNVSSDFNIVIEKPPVLCNNSNNNTSTDVKSGQSFSAYFCIQTLGSVTEVKVNSKPMVISETPEVHRSDTVYLNLSDPGIVFIRVHVPNITVRHVMTYVVSVRTKLDYVLLYRFHLNLTGSLTVCDGETKKLTANFSLGSTAIVHLCVTSDLGLDSHIGVNSQSYVINKYNSERDKLGVTAHRNTNRGSTEYYIQMYIQNITSNDIQDYTLLIKPTLHIHLSMTVQLQLPVDEYPHWCKDSNPQMYIPARTGSDATLRLCVVTSKTTKSVIVTRGNRYNTAEFTIANSSKIVNFSRGRGGAEREHVINLHISNVTRGSFTRHDVLMNFDTNVTWRHTFYLINIEDSDLCPLETCSVSLAQYEQTNQRGTLCLPAYGQLDSRVKVNDVDYMVNEDVVVYAGHQDMDDAVEPVDDILVYNEWSLVTSQRCVLLDLDHVTQDSFTLYNVTLIASGLLYTFKTAQTKDHALTSQIIINTTHDSPKEEIGTGASTGRDGGSFSSDITSAQIPLVMISIILSMMSFLLFTLLVCFFVIRGKRTRSSSSASRKGSEVTLSSRMTAGNVSNFLNSTLNSQGTERSLLSADDYQMRNKTARDNSADYSTLSGIYITPLELEAFGQNN